MDRSVDSRNIGDGRCDVAEVSSNHSWPKEERASSRPGGEIQSDATQVDAAREGQGHRGSTPLTSTNFACADIARKAAGFMALPREHAADRAAQSLLPQPAAARISPAAG